MGASVIPLQSSPNIHKLLKDLGFADDDLIPLPTHIEYVLRQSYDPGHKCDKYKLYPHERVLVQESNGALGLLYKIVNDEKYMTDDLINYTIEEFLLYKLN